MQPFCQNSQLSRSLESELENAVKTGELKLSAKNLKDFPKHGERYNLQDTIIADLSRNKLLEVPSECTTYESLERLLLYHNTIKSIPNNITSLHSLMYLDISRNQLSYLPASISELVNLQCLVANNNKLVSLPEEIGEMTNLMELDVSCNEIAHLPVQIGDLANLRSLHLRRNHLQEVPVELTYLQLTFLDLAGNRLSCLPVELRFMVTLCDLQMEDNPLTCPPANLCGRGRVHIFKYLEIQAIKEDKKRGVLTDGEYRRSYRKTSQLNDMRFGLNSDARRKRNTADSGYGSEQPLDRRWSQEFSHENENGTLHLQPQQTEDAKRLAHRAISYRPASHVSSHVPIIKPAMMLPPIVHTRNFATHERSESPHGTNSSTSPTNSLDMLTNNAVNMNNLSIQEPVMTSSNILQNGGDHVNDVDNQVRPDQDEVQSSSYYTAHVKSGFNSTYHDKFGDNLNQVQAINNEADERRRPVQRVFNKPQGSISRSVGRLPLPTSHQSPATKSPSSPHHSGLPPPPSTCINAKEHRSLSSIQTYRQFKEQQRLARQDCGQTNYKEHKIPDPGHSSSSSVTSSLSRLSQYCQNKQDIKTVQKEAVISYMSDRISSTNSTPRAGSAGAPPDIAPPPPPNTLTNGPTSSPSRNISHNKNSTSIPTARALSVPSNRLRFQSQNQTINGPSNYLEGQGSGGFYQGHPSVNFTQKREAERVAVQDSHINHLRQQIESRLKVSLGEDLATALADGVVLCHIVNHVSPRAVSSIHVPSPAVPKLTGAKCRRNVDNFLSACRKIGIREDLICSVTDIMETKKTNTVRVAITVTELLRFYVPRNNQTINI